MGVLLTRKTFATEASFHELSNALGLKASSSDYAQDVAKQNQTPSLFYNAFQVSFMVRRPCWLARIKYPRTMHMATFTTAALLTKLSVRESACFISSPVVWLTVLSDLNRTSMTCPLGGGRGPHGSEKQRRRRAHLAKRAARVASALGGLVVMCVFLTPPMWDSIA